METCSCESTACSAPVCSATADPTPCAATPAAALCAAAAHHDTFLLHRDDLLAHLQFLCDAHTGGAAAAARGAAHVADPPADPPAVGSACSDPTETPAAETPAAETPAAATPASETRAYLLILSVKSQQEEWRYIVTMGGEALPVHVSSFDDTHEEHRPEAFCATFTCTPEAVLTMLAGGPAELRTDDLEAMQRFLREFCFEGYRAFCERKGLTHFTPPPDTKSQPPGIAQMRRSFRVRTPPPPPPPPPPP